MFDFGQIKKFLESALVQHDDELVEVDEGHPRVLRLRHLGALIEPVCLRRVLGPVDQAKVDDAGIDVRLHVCCNFAAVAVLSQEDLLNADVPAELANGSALAAEWYAQQAMWLPAALILVLALSGRML
jgi:hypothetical protein